MADQPEVFEFTTKTGKGEDAASHTGSVILGSSAADAIERFGDDVVYGLFRQQAVVRAQAAVRSLMREGKSGEEIDAFLEEWRPDTKRTPAPKDPAQAAAAAFGKLTKEQKAELIKQLQAQMKKS